MTKTRVPNIEELIDTARKHFPDQALPLLRRAYEVAAQAHAGQKRDSGAPYVEHCLAVAGILADLRLDPPTLAAALLHDVLEDTEITLDDLNEQFGQEVSRLVDGVTKLSRIKLKSFEENEAESLRKMFLAMADDIRVVLIKLADRLHNMRTLDALSAERQRRIAQETLDIFAPLANRLGIWQLKSDLEDLALRYLQPEEYDRIAHLLAERRASRETYVDSVIRILQERLTAESIEAEVSGRSKHIYSIYKKMERKDVAFSQIYDLHGVRIIVKEVRDCYAAMGVVHSLWRPIPGQIDDYIAMPKENLYQSLHTAVVGPERKPLEVQIRTEEMHQIAEYGVAAHWRYKENMRRDRRLEEKIAWVRQQMEWRRELTDPQEFVDSLKTDVFQDQVYVFTPKTDIIDLPAGATPIDFAYRIHTEVGHRCRGAKVDGRLVALDYTLKTGEQVEIITAKRGGPSRDWLNPHLGYVRTSRARSKIRQWFRRQDRDLNITQGREVLERELKRLGVEQESFEGIARLFKFDKVEDLLAAIGYGDVNAHQIASKVLQAEPHEPDEVSLPEVAPPPAPVEGIIVGGMSNVLTRLARCCNPLPGDDIVGYVTRGRGISIHRRDCPNILDPNGYERQIEVAWGTATREVYPVVIKITAFDRVGLMADVSNILAGEGINITAAATTTSRKDLLATMTVTVEIDSAAQLSRILSRIDHLSNVLEARRQTG